MNMDLNKRRTLTLGASAAALAALPRGAANAAPAAPGGLRSATALTFGSDGVLFVGDSLASRVHAFFVDEPAATVREVNVANIDEEVAGLVGARGSGVVITDMAVNPVSNWIYLAVHRGNGRRMLPAIVRVAPGTGRPQLVDLGRLRSSFVDLPRPVSLEARLQYGQPQRVFTITDLHFYDNELLVTGISNEEFASTLRRIRWPFDGSLNVATLEMWHTVHNQWETRAPVIAQTVQVIGGEPHLIAAYACSPIVRFKLADLQHGKHVRGETIAELGYGNSPIDLVRYRDPFDNGREYVLITNDQRSPVRIDPNEFGKAPALSGQILHPTGLAQQSMPFAGTRHIDMLGDRLAVAIRRNVHTDELNLVTVNAGLFLDRTETVVEFQFPGVKDTFADWKLTHSETPAYRDVTTAYPAGRAR